MSFWTKPRQIMIMDAHGGRPARNFYVRMITVVLVVAGLIGGGFALGAWFAPFHSVQEIIPENMKLKRENQALQRSLTDAKTVNELKAQQLESLQEQLAEQDREMQELTKELQMFKSILEQRKGKGVQVARHRAMWLADGAIDWQVLFVKGGSYPRYLRGTYQLFALDEQGHRLPLYEEPERYRFETHTTLAQKFEWKENWKPTKLELVVYNYRKKEVMKQEIRIQGI